MRTIVIGCGKTVEKVYGLNIKFAKDQLRYPIAFHTHAHCTTVDINPICSPTVVMDICTADPSEVTDKLGHNLYDLIVLENILVTINFLPDEKN
ncbi:MAG: hypothetical protein KAH18_03305 [Psychromonas sp.]|nr:hypothetical protein [Psychromonas sp.]